MNMNRHFLALLVALFILPASASFPSSGLSAQTRENDLSSIQSDKRQKKVDKAQKAAEHSRQEGIMRKVEDARMNDRIPVPYRSKKTAGSASAKPQMAPMPSLSPFEKQFRIGKSKLVLHTEFLTRDDAYSYVSDLLADKHYDIDNYDPSYAWLCTSWELVPTPAGWVKPYSPNQFRLRFDFDRYKGGVRVIISAQWRESVISDTFQDLKYQPSDRYSTYFAWNILENMAILIPNRDITFE